MGISIKLTASVAAFLFFRVAEGIVVKNENSLFGPYSAGGENLAYWDLIGTAQLGGNVIRLTTDEPGKQGAVWNHHPVYTNNWELHMQFHIHGKGVRIHGDGMAVWYVKDRLHLGPVFGYKNHFSGLGIFIDTFENQADQHKHKHPYISAMVNNGSVHYEHDEDGTAAQVGGCYVPVRNLEWATRIAISYISNTLTVYVDADGSSQWGECFRSPGIHLPTGYHFGVSASTSENSDNHDVVSITTLDMNLPDKQSEDKSHVIPFAEHIQIPPKYRRQVVEEKSEEKQDAEAEDSQEIPAAQPASLTRKLIYIGGTGVILLMAVSLYKKYSAQRRERMQKRLY